MIVDCARRDFRNSTEKVIWLLVVVLAGWIGALIYFIVVKNINPLGLTESSRFSRRLRRR